MKRIKIANTDLELSPIGLGTVNAGLSWDHEEAAKIFENYLAAGGNLIDTAHVYSDWVEGEVARAERVIGEWIRSRKKRDDFILMTKGGHPRMNSMEVSRLSKEEMTKDLNFSLAGQKHAPDGWALPAKRNAAVRVHIRPGKRL